MLGVRTITSTKYQEVAKYSKGGMFFAQYSPLKYGLAVKLKVRCHENWTQFGCLLFLPYNHMIPGGSYTRPAKKNR